MTTQRAARLGAQATLCSFLLVNGVSMLLFDVPVFASGGITGVVIGVTALVWGYNEWEARR